ncbi:anaerobic ribonucleoside-triphosphate reductase activating protein [Halomonas sp. M4R1S46]|uniref:anaerobic ribonucleoside-triphosphate reductase activating protein n=1 Tax=Halomonas sp. M4R1S46 TaxID=2982692 RepID=UPI0021E4CC2C|nr:anaerobic ribonucleoside-triphosphate reductase activating protein [Halomonas sp. M4R1S46]UYG07676.1 anaerobic ribonucleoside-triphosphate reductase activating protein [Halomonas sp. M4R1S46]
MMIPALSLDAEPARPLHLPLAGLTTLDAEAFPGRRATVVYLQGCPLQCGYCENGDMMAPRRGETGEWDAVEAYLASRLDRLEAVVFSGGEPTLHADLPAVVTRVRELGLAVGLHTAGPYPDRLARLLPWLDWVALDVKGRGAAFDRIGGRDGVWRRHARSLEALLAGDVAFECRTTLHWRDFDLADVERLAMTLADCGVRRYALQLARTERCQDPDYRRPVAGAPSWAALETLVRRLRPHFARLTLRH